MQISIAVATFYVAVMVPFNAAFTKTDKVTMASDVIVEALFIVGKFFTVNYYRSDLLQNF